jgi:hypothetical protein
MDNIGNFLISQVVVGLYLGALAYTWLPSLSFLAAVLLIYCLGCGLILLWLTKLTVYGTARQRERSDSSDTFVNDRE